MAYHADSRLIAWAIAAAWTLVFGALVRAHEPTIVHTGLNELGARLVCEHHPVGPYSQICNEEYIARLRQGACDEDAYDLISALNCNQGRSSRHFYHPFTREGGRYPIWAAEACPNALQWARNDGGPPLISPCSGEAITSGMTWTGAVLNYGYTAVRKKAAYQRLGHVAHLLADMAQPDHVHLESHRHLGFAELGDNDFIEGWTADEWERLEPIVYGPGLPIWRFRDMEQFLHSLARATWLTTSFPGTLSEERYACAHRLDIACDPFEAGCAVGGNVCSEKVNGNLVACRPGHIPSDCPGFGNSCKERGVCTSNYTTFCARFAVPTHCPGTGNACVDDYGLCMPNNGASGLVSEMFKIEYGLTWTAENYSDMDPGFQSDLGNWQGGSGGVDACGNPSLTNDETDDWWECHTETRPYMAELCGYFAFEEMGQAIPRKFITLTWSPAWEDYSGADFEAIPWATQWNKLVRSQIDDGTRYSLREIYMRQLLPKAISHIAGLYMTFFDIVNHPPVLAGVNVEQGGGCKYGKEWVPGAGFESRVLMDSCPGPADGGWINGNAGEVTVRLRFGADFEAPPGVPITKVMSGENGDITVRLVRGPDVIDIPGALGPDGSTWTGQVEIAADGAWNGFWTISVSAKDGEPHYQHRTFSGHELDARPDSLAKALPTPPYEWADYEPGPDLNHGISIDTTAPTITVGAANECLGGRMGAFQVSDTVSGLQSIQAIDAAGVDLVPSATGVMVLPVPGGMSGSATLVLSDVAGNQTLQPVVIPYADACARGTNSDPDVIRVRIFGDSEFDPRSVALPAWRLGPAEFVSRSYQDANHDGHEDLVLHFSAAELGTPDKNDGTCLVGSTGDGRLVVSCEVLRDCNPMAKFSACMLGPSQLPCGCDDLDANGDDDVDLPDFATLQRSWGE